MTGMNIQVWIEASGWRAEIEYGGGITAHIVEIQAKSSIEAVEMALKDLLATEPDPDHPMPMVGDDVRA